MSRIIIQNDNYGAIDIKGLSLLSNRQLMKLNIYINSLPVTIAVKNENQICFHFTIIEEHLQVNVLSGLINHLEKNGYVIEVANDILLKLNSQEELIEKLNSNINKLKLIKDDSIVVKAEFEEFCNFCDNALKIKLRAYQYKSAFLLSIGKGGFDFSVPGSGKTIITYAAYSYMKHLDIVDHLFVIGPGSSYNAWMEEYMTCFEKQPSIENLSDMSTRECCIYLSASSKNHKEISFVNTEKVRLIKNEITQCVTNNRTLLIIDEAHKIKNPDAIVTQSIMEISKHAQGRIILTGTPMPNGYEDLYSLTKTLSPVHEILPFNYIQLKSMSKTEATKKQSDIIKKSISPYYSRISKKFLLETKELLPPNYHIINCEMDNNQLDLYLKLNEFCGKIDDNVEGDILSYLKKAILIRKMQISANPALLENGLVNSMDELRSEYHNQYEKYENDIDFLVKADKQLMNDFASSSIYKIVKQFSNGTLTTEKNKLAVSLTKKLIESNQKVLIWDIFVKNMDILKDMIESTIKMKVEMINGSVVGYDRLMALKRFREGDSMILLANPATLAESISLHKVCQNAIYVNRNFNAAQYIQSKDRIHRINMPLGTTANYYFIINNQTIDFTINEKLNLKEQRMLAILEADDIEIGGAEMEDSKIMSSQDVDDSYWR